MRKSEPIEGKTELLVYSCHSVENGRELRIFDEDDIQAAGGIYGVEMELQRDSYWFVRMGTIEGQKTASGWSCTDEALAKLPEADPHTWCPGRRNPSFQRGQLEREIFESLYQELSAFLKNWNHEEDGMIDAYAIKEISISPNRVSSIASALTSIRQAYEVIGMTVFKYWYDPAWKLTGPSSDLILAEFPLSIPVRFQLCSAEKVIAVDILSILSC
jgi:hypothetical protein